MQGKVSIIGNWRTVGLSPEIRNMEVWRGGRGRWKKIKISFEHVDPQGSVINTWLYGSGVQN